MRCSATLSRDTLSTLVTIATTGAFASASSRAIHLSPGPIFSSAGKQKPITSTDANVSRTRSFSR